MEDISKVAQVIGVATKKDGSELRGIGKNGREWVMYSIVLENGVRMNTFGPVSIGDIMFNLKQDPQYHNWKGELKRQGDGTKAATSTKVDKSQPTLADIMNELQEIKKMLSGNKDKKSEDKKEVVLTDDDFDDSEPVDLSEIPFN